MAFKFGRVFGMLLIGALATIIPAIVSKFIPQIAGSTLMLGVGLIVIGMFIAGKVPYLPQAMLVAGGGLVLSPILQKFLGGITQPTALEEPSGRLF